MLNLSTIISLVLIVIFRPILLLSCSTTPRSSIISCSDVATKVVSSANLKLEFFFSAVRPYFQGFSHDKLAIDIKKAR